MEGKRERRGLIVLDKETGMDFTAGQRFKPRKYSYLKSMEY